MKQNDKFNRVVIEGNNIYLNMLNHPACVSEFLYTIRAGIKNGYRDFVIHSHADAIFPNACAPIAGIIEYYNIIKKVSFSYHLDSDSYLSKCGFEHVLYKTSQEILNEHNPFDKIFSYDASEQVAALTQAYINYISEVSECAEGVIDGLIWCINEVMDNVLLHGNVKKGFVMAQLHPQTGHIAICVYDNGIGIYNSLKSSKHKPLTGLDAISLSIQEGVGDGQGQGNGLFGLYEIVQKNRGSVTITSGAASLMYKPDGETKKFKKLPCLDTNNTGTTVDFQLDITRSIDIKSAFKNIGGFDGFDIRIDDMLEDNNSIKYDVFENCKGTATRDAGRLLRNDVYNIWNRKKTVIQLDFSKVKSVSSSFVDEFVAKLLIKFGVIAFNQIFRITGMNDTVRYLCERSIYMRIHDQWNELK